VVERYAGRASELHARVWPSPLARTVWVLAVDRPALVLGSTQPPVAAPAGVDVAQRHSGGAGVWLEPGGTLWIDVLVPRSDSLWDDDVARSALWLGEAWVRALRAVDLDGVVHTGPMVRGAAASAVCFASVAPGEVTAGRGGPKVVGISQRRTRAGARFQCVVYERWDPESLARVLGVAGADVAGVGAGVGAGSLAALESAFRAALPQRD